MMSLPSACTPSVTASLRYNFDTAPGIVRERVRKTFRYRDCRGRIVRDRVNEVIQAVAADVGNTPAVCKRSYIDPRITAIYLSGTSPATRPGAIRGLSADESFALRLLRPEKMRAA
jgi:DNA topoisomerase IB